jgi:hypothetical protein
VFFFYLEDAAMPSCFNNQSIVQATAFLLLRLFWGMTSFLGCSRLHFDSVSSSAVGYGVVVRKELFSYRDVEIS